MLFLLLTSKGALDRRRVDQCRLHLARERVEPFGRRSAAFERFKRRPAAAARLPERLTETGQNGSKRFDHLSGQACSSTLAAALADVSPPLAASFPRLIYT